MTPVLARRAVMVAIVLWANRRRRKRSPKAPKRRDT